MNAGHLPPLLQRDGHVEPVPLPPNLPLGLQREHVFSTGEVHLQPGDRLVIVTDGMQERNAKNLDLYAVLLTVADLHPREATRAPADAVLQIRAGRPHPAQPPEQGIRRGR